MAFVFNRQFDEAFDHDFPGWATGKIILHGIWDPFRNHGHLYLGLSHDTAQFACDSFRWFWNSVMRKAYETGRHATQEFRQNMKFKRDKVLPRWNYTAQVQID